MYLLRPSDLIHEVLVLSNFLLLHLVECTLIELPVRNDKLVVTCLYLHLSDFYWL